MKKILEALEQELKAAFTPAAMKKNSQKWFYPTARTCANISATALWQLPRHIKRNLSTLQMQW